MSALQSKWSRMRYIFRMKNMSETRDHRACVHKWSEYRFKQRDSQIRLWNKWNIWCYATSCWCTKVINWSFLSWYPKWVVIKRQSSHLCKRSYTQSMMLKPFVSRLWFVIAVSYIAIPSCQLGDNWVRVFRLTSELALYIRRQIRVHYHLEIIIDS